MRPPLLLVPGACSQAAHFEPWVGYFREARFRATAMSLPGHGSSEPDAVKRSTLKDYVKAVVDMVESFDQPPVLIGHSLGGILGMKVAALGKIAGLVVIAAPAPGEPPIRPSAIVHAFPLVWRILTGLPVKPSPKMVRFLVTHDLSPAESDEIIAAGAWESGRVLRRLAFGGTWTSLRTIRCPVLALGAGDDRVVSPSAAARIARATGGELVVFPGHSHWLIAGSLTAAVAEIVREWLERHFLHGPTAAETMPKERSVAGEQPLSRTFLRVRRAL